MNFPRLICGTMAFVLLAARGNADGPLPAVLRNTGVTQRLNESVPLDLEFRNEVGQSVTLSQVAAGKPVILVLAYFRCPMLCNQVLNGLVESLRQVSLNPGESFEVIVVSMDARETPDLAAAKRQHTVDAYGRPGGDRGWHFLTGSQDHIVMLAQAVGIRFAYDPRQDQFAHPSAVTILTPDGRVSRYFFGIDFAPTDMRLALVEAGQGSIGSPIDQVMLLCYRYDPSTGRYTPAALTFVRIGGASFAIVLIAALVRSWRREWRTSRIGGEA